MGNGYKVSKLLAPSADGWPSGWKSHDQGEDRLFHAQWAHHPHPLTVAYGHQLTLGAIGNTWKDWTTSHGSREPWRFLDGRRICKLKERSKYSIWSQWPAF